MPDKWNGNGKKIMMTLALVATFGSGALTGAFYMGTQREVLMGHVKTEDIHTSFADTQEIARQVVAFESWPLLVSQFKEVNKRLDKIDAKLEHIQEDQE